MSNYAVDTNQDRPISLGQESDHSEDENKDCETAAPDIESFDKPKHEGKGIQEEEYIEKLEASPLRKVQHLDIYTNRLGQLFLAAICHCQSQTKVQRKVKSLIVHNYIGISLFAIPFCSDSKELIWRNTALWVNF